MSLSFRKTNKDTVVSGKSLTVFLPDSMETAYFDEIVGKLRGVAASVSVEQNPDDRNMVHAGGPVIVIGNLADNKCVERLYYDFLSATDRWYPGPEGYEVRTLLDPYGTGYNVIHIGYSDRKGLGSAVAYFKGQIRDVIPFQKEVRPTRLHIPDEYADHIFNDELDSSKDTYYYSIRPENKGYLAYLTGNGEVLADYTKAFREILGMPFQHLMFYNRFVVWRLLEVTGMLEGDVLEKAPGFFLDWAGSKEGVGSIDRHQYQSPHLTRNNHGTIPALGIKMFSVYLKTYHPDIKEAARYEELADNVYRPYFAGSWKPQCDGLCHGWWLSQPVLLHYGLLDPEKKYFKFNGAKKAAECAIAVIANDGYLPGAGDSLQNRQHPGFVLRIAAQYYKDGRYKHANDILPFELANSGEMSAMPRQFDIGLEPIRPNDGGTTIVPVDPLIYETWQHEDEYHSRMVTDTPPAGPIEKCFDKISFRSGWDKGDDFMLVDGIGGGGHSYSDAGSIIEYSSHGIPFLVAEDRLTYVEPENHNLVTISKDGLRQPIPAFPLIEDIKEYEDGVSYLRILSKDNNGADWTREIYFVPGVGSAVRDHIRATEEGVFSVEAHFRTPGSVLPREDGYVSIRNDREGNRVAFVLMSLDQDAGITFERRSYNHLFRTPPGKESPDFIGLDNRALFLERYRIRNPEITEFKAKYNKKLAKGESVVFTHFFATAMNNEVPASASLTEGGVEISSEGFFKALGFLNKSPENLIDFDPEQPEFDFFSELVHEESSSILSVDMEKDLMAIGMISGEIAVGIPGNEPLWTVKEEEAVPAVCLHEGVVYSSAGAGGLAAHRKGVNLWRKKFDRTPTMFYWWELENQRIVTLKAFGNILLAGCGDDCLRCFSTDGEFLWSYYYRASVPAGFEINDIDSDGEMEIIIYGGLLGAYSQIEIIDMNGKLKYTPNESIGAGWTSYTTAFRIIEFSGEKYIVQGVNRNRNLVVYKFEKQTGKFSEAFSHSLAGAVTALYFEGGIIYAGTSLGFISAYDMTGSRLWFKALNGGLKYITGASEGLLAIESEGTMYRLSDQGETVLMSMDSMRASRIIEGSEAITLVQDRGIYRIPRRREEYDL